MMKKTRETPPGADDGRLERNRNDKDSDWDRKNILN